MLQRVFTYGTLSIGEVMERVAGRMFPSVSAVLPGHRRRLIRGAIYPGIVEDVGEEVVGRLHDGVGEAELAKLDDFESDLYARVEIGVRVENAPGLVRAWAYRIPAAEAWRLSEELWDEEMFRGIHLARYLD